MTDASWDSWRTEGRPWTVVLTFAAGGRQRQASWSFDLADRTVSAVDDEARWLSEEVQETKGPIPAPRLRPASGRDATVYDVEAEGGLRPAARGEHQEDPLDLMTAMRRRSTARGRRKSGGRGASGRSPQAVASGPHVQEPTTEAALPIEDPVYEPETLPPPALPEQAAPVSVLADEGLTGDGSPSEAISPVEGQTQGPVEEPVRRGLPKTQAKRPTREAARKPGRPSVPAWDEIMFGSRPGADRSSS